MEINNKKTKTLDLSPIVYLAIMTTIFFIAL